MTDAQEPFRIDPDAVLNDATLVLNLGVTHAALARARREGRLRFTKSGHRILYRGRWIAAWLESNARGPHSEGLRHA